LRAARVSRRQVRVGMIDMRTLRGANQCRSCTSAGERAPTTKGHHYCKPEPHPYPSVMLDSMGIGALLGRHEGTSGLDSASARRERPDHRAQHPHVLEASLPRSRRHHRRHCGYQLRKLDVICTSRVQFVRKRDDRIGIASMNYPSKRPLAIRARVGHLVTRGGTCAFG
jgi:hypothetical protein